MQKWFVRAACVLATSTLAFPSEAAAQGGLLKKISDARRKLEEARAAKDSAAAAVRDVRGAGPSDDGSAVMPPGRGATEAAGGEVVRASSRRPGGRRPSRCIASNTFQCAEAVALGEAAEGAIGANGPELFYRFAVDEPGVYRLVLDPMPNRSTVGLSVTDAQYQELGRFGWGAGQPGAQLIQIAAPGTYYAHLTSYTSPAEPFSFTVARNTRPRPAPQRPAPDEADGPSCSLNNTFQCADDAEVGRRITGAIGGNARSLYYRVEVEQPGTMEFALNPMPNRGYVQIVVTDDQYHKLGHVLYPKGQPKTQLFRVAAPGTYYLHLTGGGQTAERFALTVRQQP